MKDYIRVMGGDNNQSDEISNNKLLEAILDIQKNLGKNTNKVTQITNSLEEIKQQDDFKKEFLSLKTNTQAPTTALEVSQLKLTESQKFINEEFEDCKSNQKNIKERAKSTETKTVNLKLVSAIFQYF